MKSHPTPLPDIFSACSRHGVTPTRYILSVNIAAQTTSLYEQDSGASVSDEAHGAAGAQNGNGHYRLTKTYRCSTSKFGIGETVNSNKTPRGLHRVAEKHGGDYPAGAVFEGRKMVGYTWEGRPSAPIAHRILWLEGLEPGLNRGGEVDSFRRYIYIHGVGDETTLGRPASHGCVHLAAEDLIPLYDKVPVDTLVWIAEE